MRLLTLAPASGSGSRLYLKPIMILFCLVSKVTSSASKVISLIRSTSYPLLGPLITFAMLGCLMQQVLEGYIRNPGFDPRNRARFVKTQTELLMGNGIWPLLGRWDSLQSWPGMRAELGKKKAFGIKNIVFRVCKIVVK